MTTSPSNNSFGVILVNLGSPSAPTQKAVKAFLLSFLSDYRVVDKPKWLWQPILRGIIIPLRLKKVTHAYSSIWTDNGSPLIAISKQQQEALQTYFNENEDDIQVELAMTYNEPSLENSFNALKAKGISKIVVLPLYPQYSSTTSAAVFDAVANTVKAAKCIPELRNVQDYYQHPLYIKALANSIKLTENEKQECNKSQLLIFSFHGLPQRYVDLGDPYQAHCEQTAKLVANELGLNENQWMIAYQSRVGREPWLQPYLDQTLEELPQQGVKNVTVICPAFSADCLETLEEIEIENKALFVENGGEQYHYIPALNANSDHIKMMVALVKEQLVGWQ